MMSRITEQIRECAEQCSNLQGFIITHSTTGSTGAGLTSLISEHLANDYTPKSQCVVTLLDRDPRENQLINSIMAMSSLTNNAHLAICMDNQSLSSICKNNLELSVPSLQDLNRLVAFLLGSFTSPIRHNGPLNADLYDIVCNLQPYQKTHFTIPSVVPVLSKSKMNFKTLNAQLLTSSLFLNENQFLECDLVDAKYLSCFLAYQGTSFGIDHIYDSIHSVLSKNSTKYVDYIDGCDGLKVSLNSHPPYSSFLQKISEISVCRIANTTSISKQFKKIENNVEKSASRIERILETCSREGMERSEFIEALESLRSLIDEYEKACSEIPKEEKKKDEEEEDETE